MNSFALADVAKIVVALAAGFALGACHFASLRWNVRLFGAGRAASAACVQLLRVGLTAAALFALVRVGPAALVAGMGGFLFARTVALRGARIDGGRRT